MVHRVIAIEKYRSKERHKPFGCSATDCNAWSEQPKQYTAHRLTTRHGDNEAVSGRVKELFDDNAKRLERIQQESKAAHSCFWDWWREIGTEQRNLAEKEVMDQLEHDELSAQDKPVVEHGILREIRLVEFWGIIRIERTS